MLEQKVTPTVLMLDKSGSYSFDARIKIVTEMYCSHQYPEMYWCRQYLSECIGLENPVAPTIFMLSMVLLLSIPID